MSILPLQPARVSNLLSAGVATQSIGSTQAQLLKVQNEISTGKQLTLPSDNPGAAAVVAELKHSLRARQTYSANVNLAGSQLGAVDTSLGSLTDLLRQAQSLASADAGTDVPASRRAADADVVQTLYDRALALGNQQFNGSYLFGGDKNNTAPFVESNGGVQFVGSSNLLQNQVDDNQSMSFQVDGAAVFGATSTAVAGSADLTPQLTAQTRLADLKGANGAGIRLGSIQLSNGTTTKVVDLSHADSVGDVVAAIDAAGVGNVTASIGPNGTLTLTGGGADNVTVDEVAGGTTASDLGLYHPTASGAGAPVHGAAVRPVVSPLTPLSALRGGVGIDTAGLVITNGSAKATVAFTSPPLPSPPTVQDLLNAVNGSGANVLARVNAAGTGIDIVNPNQGTRMTIAENGGTTAADLGVRSFSGATELSALNGGRGVGTVAGPDFTITRADGSTFGVDIDGAKTVQDVIARINAADTNNGAQPARLVASVSAGGNGITLTDSTGGAGAPAVAATAGSTAAADLGLTGAGATTAGNVLSGADVNPVAADGVFSHLAKLRDALSANDAAGITAAGQGIQADQDRVIGIRGAAGATAQALQAKQTQLGDEDLAANTLLSSLQDTDFTTAITKFQSLQTAMQATLETAAKTLHLSLMDFLQ